MLKVVLLTSLIKVAESVKPRQNQGDKSVNLQKCGKSGGILPRFLSVFTKMVRFYQLFT